MKVSNFEQKKEQPHADLDCSCSKCDSFVHGDWYQCLEVINQQIESAQEEVIKTKKKYDAATDLLKSLRDKKKELQTEELMAAVMKSKHSYEDILQYIRSDIVEV